MNILLRYCAIMVLAFSAVPGLAQNLLTNGTFDADIDGWGSTEDGAVWRGDVGSTLTGGSGPGCVEIFAEGDTCNGGQRSIIQTVPVIPETLMTVRASAYVPGGDNNAEQAGMIVDWLNESDQIIAVSELTPSSAARDTWFLFEDSLPVPTDASQAQLLIGVAMPSGGCTTRARVFFDDVWFAPRAADLYVPAAAATAGSNGTYWSTTLWARNPNTTSVRLEGAFLAAGHDNSAAISAPSSLGVISAGGTLEVTDVVTALGASGSGGLSLRAVEDASGNPPPQELNVVTYTFTPNPSGGGNFGQGIPAEEQGKDRLVRAPGVRRDESFRTNVGILNTSGETITVAIRIVAADGSTAGSASWELPPYSQRQVGVDKLGASVIRQGVAEFQRTAGSGGFRAYLSRVDNVSGDAVYVAAR